MVYRGPERRGAERVPPPLELEDPASQFWRRAALVAPLAGVCALTAAAVAAEGFEEVRTAHASLRLCWAILTLAAGAALTLRWRLTGEAPVALLGAALVVWSLPQLPFALADVAVDPEATWRRLGPLTRMTVMVPAAWLLLRCIRSPQVDSGLRPVREALGYSLAATAAAGALTAGQELDLVAPSSPLARAFTGGLLAALLLAFACLFAGRGHRLARPVARRTAVAFGGLGAAAQLTVGARFWDPMVVVLAESVAVVSSVVLLLLAASLLRSAVDFFGVRMLSLHMQADSAGEAVRREQQRIHELRATVAGIRQASGTLSRYGDRLDPDREHDLQRMMAAELERLERLLSTDRHESHPGPVMLDDLICPLVTAHREQGGRVQWRPTRTCAVARRDDVSEILHVLLTNARVHAPGAEVQVVVEERDGAVRVVVADDGPGLADGVRDDVFEDGARRDGSPGGGLGLHIARELATGSGGRLSLIAQDPGEQGACFVLTLPAVSDPTATRIRGPIGSGDPG